MNCQAWAYEEFGGTDTGDGRLTTRVVAMAAQALNNPQGTVSDTFQDGAERLGAYRFLEHERETLADAMDVARNRACASHMAGGGVFVVPIDQTSIRLSDPRGEFGSVGNRSKQGRGVQVMTALALDGEGTAMGVLGQRVWCRSEESGPKRLAGRDKKERDERPASEKESRFWPEMMVYLGALVAAHAPGARVWVQCDRGADFWQTFTAAIDAGLWFTVRLCHERVVRRPDGSSQMLSAWVADQVVATYKTVAVPERNGRPARQAICAVRLGTVDFELKCSRYERRVERLSVVEVTEIAPRPGDAPIHWRLLTNFPVASVEDAELVLDNYTLRWRVEDFHRCWKSGGCQIEASRLQSFRAFHRWAVLTSSVAVRIEQIKHLSRAKPEEPATELFSREELDALILLHNSGPRRDKGRYKPGDTPTVAVATRWLAVIGGYFPNRRRPPGSLVLTRGYQALQMFLLGLQAERLSREKM